MSNCRTLLRLTAVVLVGALLLGLAVPDRAEADILTTIAIASLVLAGVIIIVYLVVANLADRGKRQAGDPVLLACVESDAEPRACWPVAAESALTAPAREALHQSQ